MTVIWKILNDDSVSNLGSSQTLITFKMIK